MLSRAKNDNFVIGLYLQTFKEFAREFAPSMRTVNHVTSALPTCRPNRQLLFCDVSRDHKV